MKTRLLTLFAATLALLAAAVWMPTLRGSRAATLPAAPPPAPSPSSLPVLAAVPDFHLVDDEGRAVTRAHLLGHPWILNFAFTRCATSCPMVMAELRKIRKSLAKVPTVRTVTVTVDPEHDRPAELRGYRKMQGPDDKRWMYLTGEKKEIISLMQGIHLLPPGPAVKLGMDSHSTRLVLVDETGHVRGYFDYKAAGESDRLVAVMQTLGGPATP